MSYHRCEILLVCLCALVTSVVYCKDGREFGVIDHTTTETGRDADGDHAEYWSYVRALNATLTSQKYTADVTNQLTFDTINPGNSYTAAFENYIVRSRLFKGKFDVVSTPQITGLLNVINSSQLACEEFCSRSQAISDDRLSNVGDKLVIPKFAANNYLRKRLVEPDADAARESPYFTEWPALRHVHANRPTRAMQCPANMHMLAWHYSSHSHSSHSHSSPSSPSSSSAQTADLVVRAFPLETSFAYFKSSFFVENARERNGTFSGYFTQFLRSGFPDIHDQRGDDGDLTKPAADIIDTDKLPAFAETILRTSSGPDAGEYVFIPNTHVVSFQCAVEWCPVMAVCFVDASNLNLFRDALHFHSAVGATEEVLHRTFTSPSFDFDLPKSPVDLTLNAYLTLTAVAPGTAEAATTTGSTSAATGASASANNNNNNNNRRDRRKKTGGGADFKDWQELSRWKMLLTSLTIRKPAAPTVAAVGRQDLTLSWHSPFVPAASDMTVFGFRVVYCPVAEEQGQQGLWQEEIALPFNSNSSSSSADARIAAVACGSQKILRAAPADIITGKSTSGESVLQEELDVAFLRRTGQEAVLFRAVVHGLQPDTQYQLRLSVLYDQKEGPLSAYTAPVRTAPVSTPSAPLGTKSSILAGGGGSAQSPKPRAIEFSTITRGYKSGQRMTGKLSFGWPEDDGGLPITGFHVYWRPAPPSSTEEQLWEVPDRPWQWLGAFPAERSADKATGQILMLNVPNYKACQFSIASYNLIGSSYKSLPSEVIVMDTQQPSSHHVLHGWGHEHYLGELTAAYLHEHADVHSGAESSTEHGAGARLMVDHALSTDCSAASGDGEMIFVDGSKQLIYSIDDHCKHIGTEDTIQSPKLEVWRAHWAPQQLAVFAQLALVDSLVQTVEFGGHMTGKIVFSPRGDIPFTEKAVRAQRAGAAALVVIDGGACVKYDQKCLPGASKAHNEGFGALDVKAHWDRVHIPVYFILQNEARKLALNLNLPLSHGHSEL